MRRFAWNGCGTARPIASAAARPVAAAAARPIAAARTCAIARTCAAAARACACAGTQQWSEAIQPAFCDHSHSAVLRWLRSAAGRHTERKRSRGVRCRRPGDGQESLARWICQVCVGGWNGVADGRRSCHGGIDCGRQQQRNRVDHCRPASSVDAIGSDRVRKFWFSHLGRRRLGQSFRRLGKWAPDVVVGVPKAGRRRSALGGLARSAAFCGWGGGGAAVGGERLPPDLRAHEQEHDVHRHHGRQPTIQCGH